MKDKELDADLKQIDGMEEDYRAQHAEMKRRMVLERAVELAENILTEYSDGVELELLTAEMARIYLEKVVGRLQSKLLSEEIKSVAKKLHS